MIGGIGGFKQRLLNLSKLPGSSRSRVGTDRRARIHPFKASDFVVGRAINDQDGHVHRLNSELSGMLGRLSKLRNARFPEYVTGVQC